MNKDVPVLDINDGHWASYRAIFQCFYNAQKSKKNKSCAKLKRKMGTTTKGNLVHDKSKRAPVQRNRPRKSLHENENDDECTRRTPCDRNCKRSKAQRREENDAFSNDSESMSDEIPYRPTAYRSKAPKLEKRKSCERKGGHSDESSCESDENDRLRTQKYHVMKNVRPKAKQHRKGQSAYCTDSESEEENDREDCRRTTAFKEHRRPKNSKNRVQQSPCSTESGSEGEEHDGSCTGTPYPTIFQRTQKGRKRVPKHCGRILKTSKSKLRDENSNIMRSTIGGPAHTSSNSIDVNNYGPSGTHNQRSALKTNLEINP
ncbi:unnamed protein product [Agarophyton chilense]